MMMRIIDDDERDLSINSKINEEEKSWICDELVRMNIFFLTTFFFIIVS